MCDFLSIGKEHHTGRYQQPKTPSLLRRNTNTNIISQELASHLGAPTVLLWISIQSESTKSTLSECLATPHAPLASAATLARHSRHPSPCSGIAID